jgi:hypothetical protein
VLDLKNCLQSSLC